jgi:hypothetical protein
VYNLLRRYQGLPIIDVGNLDVPLQLDSATMYRKASDCQTWHFCTNCSHWPEADYEELAAAPESGELCNQCKTLREERNCL